MDIDLRIFDSKRIITINPYEVNTGFIWCQLSIKSSFEAIQDIYKPLFEEFNEFLTFYQFLFDEQEEIISCEKFSLDKVHKLMKTITEHKYYTNHSIRMGDNCLELYCYASDVCIDVLSCPEVVFTPPLSWVFALQLNLMDIGLVTDFLDYQYQEIFSSNSKKFVRYIESLLIEYEKEEWFSEKHLRRVKMYLVNDFNSPIEQFTIYKTPQMLDMNRNKIDSIDLPEGTSVSKPRKPLDLPNDWKYITIKQQYSYEDLLTALSFLYIETFDDPKGETFMQKQEVQELLKYGLAFPNESGQEKFSLNIRSSRTKKLFLHCIFTFRETFINYTGSKGDLTYFLLRHFQDFKNEEFIKFEKKFRRSNKNMNIDKSQFKTKYLFDI